MMGLNILRSILACFAIYQITSGSSLNYTFEQNVTSHTGYKGAVSSESEVCSHAGTAMMLQGGNAADSVSLLKHTR